MRKATKDPMKLKKPEDAFYDFYKSVFPQYKLDFEFRDIAKLCFMAGVAWSHARIKFDIISDLSKLIADFKLEDKITNTIKGKDL